MSATTFFSSDLADRLGWTLLHSLWEGAAVAALHLVAMAALRRRSPQARYLASGGALGLLLACVVATFCALPTPPRPDVGGRAPDAMGAAVTGAAPAREVLPSAAATESARGPNTVGPAVPAVPPAPAPAVAPAAPLGAGVARVAPWLSAAWAVGVVGLSVWHLGGWVAAQRLRVLGVAPAGRDVEGLVRRLARRLGVARVPAVLRSARVETPAVVGWLRPVILLPAAVLTGLSPRQLGAVLAHELAHVRRHDYLVNLFQVAAETILFFHPATWLISRRIRLEREQCCDDVAVAVCGDRCAYAGSLAALEEVRLGGGGAVALAARGSGGGQLLARVRRLLGQADAAPRGTLRAIAALPVLVMTVGLAAGVWSHTPGAQAGEAKAAAHAVDGAWLTGVWVHRRTDKPGPEEATHRLLSFGPDGAWTTAELWGPPEKPGKVLVNNRGDRFVLDRLAADSFLGHAAIPGSPRPEYTLRFPLGENSSLGFGSMSRPTPGTIVFHQFSSIYWTTEYAKAPPPLEASLRKALLAAAAAQAGAPAVPGGGAPKADDPPAPGALAGTVTDEAGTPVGGAVVDAWTWHPGNETTTDGRGQFTLKNLGAEPVEVRISKDGFAPWYEPVQPTGGPALRVALSPKPYFEGRVTAPDGTPVAGALVRADSGPKRNPGVHIATVWTQTRTDDEGRYRLRVAPDAYAIQVRVPKVGVASLPRTPIAAGEGKRLDIPLRAGITFRATVVDAATGAPVPNVRLGHREHPGVEGTSDNDGNIAIDGMAPGRFTFDVAADGYARWWSEQAAEPHQRKDRARPLRWNYDSLAFDLAADTAPVRIELERAVRIAGVVRDPNGKPVAGATVAPAHTGTGNSITGDTRFSVPTAADGTFVMTLPASGDAQYNLVAHDGKHGQWRTWANGVAAPIRTRPGEELKDVVIALTRPATVRGRVTDETGRPIAGRRVRTSAADRLENRYYDPETKTDKDGRFELRFVRPGEQFVQVAPFWLSDGDPPAGHSVKVTLNAGDVRTDVNLTGPASTAFPSREEQLRRAIERVGREGAAR